MTIVNLLKIVIEKIFLNSLKKNFFAAKFYVKTIKIPKLDVINVTKTTNDQKRKKTEKKERELKSYLFILSRIYLIT